MPLDHATLVEAGVVQPESRDPRRRGEVVREYGVTRGELDLDEMPDEPRRRDGIVELDRQRIALEPDVANPGGRTRTAQRAFHAATGTFIRNRERHSSHYGLSPVVRCCAAFLRVRLLTRPARVVSVGRNAAWIVFDDDPIPRLASLRRSDRSQGARSMLVPGDVVDARMLDEERTVVDDVRPRSSTVERTSAGGRRTIMAANTDSLVAVAALVDPPLRLELIDRLIVFAERNALDVVLAFTKADLAGPEAAARVEALYEAPPLGYTALVLNPRTGDGIAAFTATIAGRKALLVGPSGVGKSSLFGKLGGTSVVGEVSKTGRGRQTTTAARLYRFSDGFLIDSPGIGEFVLGPMEPGELVGYFKDLREPATRCRFRNCRHLREPGCEVRAGVAAGTIAESRYQSYVAILAEAAEAMVW